MNKSRQDEAECREQRADGKKVYQAPKLTTLGTVQKLTRDNLGNGNESQPTPDPEPP